MWKDHHSDVTQRSSARAEDLGVCGCGGGGGSGLNKLNVVGGEHSKVSVWTIASPPAFVDHLDPGDDLIWVEGDLCVVSWRKGAAAQEQW